MLQSYTRILSTGIDITRGFPLYGPEYNKLLLGAATRKAKLNHGPLFSLCLQSKHAISQVTAPVSGTSLLHGPNK